MSFATFLSSLSQLKNEIDFLDAHLFARIKYEHSCTCGQNWSNIKSKNMSTQIFHFLFDYFIRLGWLDPIASEEAKLAFLPISICKLGRGTDAGGFAHVIEVRCYPGQWKLFRKL
jgi:hypothetical protein